MFLTGILALQPQITLVQKSITILPQRTDIKPSYSHLFQTQNSVSSPSTSGGTAQAPQKRKNLFGFVDLPVTPEQVTRANFKLFRFIVHANIPFLVAENWFFP
ncbi:hypothetical protein DFJ58DRAFT_843899 [Suillus subalutaceus]|uniref:uncharacterized protein n=1 Tax=Suillus subalutaceus TaxID=48586 RepID=UPI001B865F57|nr:uncharacterized protein DFJ58DRAFT_843899 [Suillus subalutaceus]KAG1844794.1 hypothetical protein DFJ58DRAFT_843899 [Suillus subalutaceus]